MNKVVGVALAGVALYGLVRLLKMQSVTLRIPRESARKGRFGLVGRRKLVSKRTTNQSGRLSRRFARVMLGPPLGCPSAARTIPCQSLSLIVK